MDILRYLRLGALPLLAPLLAGCYETIEPSLSSTPKLCMNACLTAGDTLTVSLTHTWRYTDARTFPSGVAVGDARLEVYVDGALCSTADAGDSQGNYRTDYVPRPGQTVRLVATSRRYGTAEATVSMPDEVPLLGATWTPVITNLTSLSPNGNDLLSMVDFDLTAKLRFADPVATANYYVLNLWYGLTGFTDDTLWAPLNVDSRLSDMPSFSIHGLNTDAEPLFSDYVSISEKLVFGTDDDLFDHFAFTDRLIADRTYDVTLQFTRCSLTQYSSDSTVEPPYYPVINFVLYNTSESLYKQYVWQWIYYEGLTGNMADLGLGDAVTAYSNVSTGAGVVSARTASCYQLDLRGIIARTGK